MITIPCIPNNKRHATVIVSSCSLNGKMLYVIKCVYLIKLKTQVSSSLDDFFSLSCALIKNINAISNQNINKELLHSLLLI